MPMAGMEMPGHVWPGTAADFLGMWMAMMVPMMLPAVIPTLLSYRQSRGRTGIVAFGYFAVWTLSGAIAYPFASAAIDLPPVTTGIVVIAAGAFQFTAWKARHLNCCRRPESGPSAWRGGLRLGFHCVCSCAGATAILMVTGMMDVSVMAIVAAGITLERVVPAALSLHVSRAMGTVAAASGLLLMAGVPSPPCT